MWYYRVLGFGTGGVVFWHASSLVDSFARITLRDLRVAAAGNLALYAKQRSAVGQSAGSASLLGRSSLNRVLVRLSGL